MGVNCLNIKLCTFSQLPVPPLKIKEQKTELIAGNSKNLIALKHFKRLNHDNQQPSIYYGDYHINEGSTTIPDGSTSQANGDGNALPE